MNVASTEPAQSFALDQVLGSGSLVPSFQPIVDPTSLQPTGYEALARWPEVPGANPSSVFPAAEAAGRLAELDWECRLSAIRAALDAGVGRSTTLFVNVEAAAFGHPAPPEAEALFARAREELNVMLELTERSLLERPADLLNMVRWARERGMGIALDDVGADPDSLAMLPFVAPDVIKLDIALVQQIPSSEQARTMAAILAHAERTGAAILGEGIETEAHLQQAIAFGARFGQGWLFGRPGPLEPSGKILTLALAHTSRDIPETPFDLVRDQGKLAVGRKELILAMTHHLEEQAAGLSDPPVVLAAFQTADRFTPASARRYARLAERCPLVGALGAGLSTEPTAGVRGGALSADDRLIGEWTVAVVSAHYCAALIARDLGDDGPDRDRRYEYALTHDRETSIAAARSLMRRLVAHRP